MGGARGAGRAARRTVHHHAALTVAIQRHLPSVARPRRALSGPKCFEERVMYNRIRSKVRPASLGGNAARKKQAPAKQLARVRDGFDAAPARKGPMLASPLP